MTWLRPGRAEIALTNGSAICDSFPVRVPCAIEEKEIEIQNRHGGAQASTVRHRSPSSRARDCREALEEAQAQADA